MSDHSFHATIRANHEREMRVLEDRHARELEEARRDHKTKSARSRRILATVLGCWFAVAGLGIGTAVAFTDPDPVQNVSVYASAGAELRDGRSRMRMHMADARIDRVRTIRRHISVAADASKPAVDAGPRRHWRRPVKAPVDKPVHQCDASSGDPCCAFGKIVC